MISGALADILRDGRARFNAKFQEARHFCSSLEPEPFARHLEHTLAPLVEVIAAVAPGQAAVAAEALFDLSLTLAAQNLLGPSARFPVIAEGWRELLPALAAHVAAGPRLIAGAVTNALYNLAATPGARPAEWLELMKAAAPHCPDSDSLLNAGQVAAWQAGMAHYRATALAKLEQLAPAVARVVCGLPVDAPCSSIEMAVRLSANPWLDPRSLAGAGGRGMKLAAAGRVGAFRGFGGQFRAPPIVIAREEEGFIVRDGDSDWILYADARGASMQRIERYEARALAVASAFSLTADGLVTAGGFSLSLPELAGFTSAVSNGATLAVTTAYSHAIVLVALLEQ